MRSMASVHVKPHELSTMTKSSYLKFRPSRIHRSQPQGGPAPFLARTLPLTAFKDNIFMSYLVSKFFGEFRHPLNAAEETRCGLPINWIAELIETNEKPRCKSWDALATVLFGQAHKSYDLITTALILYVQALSELRNQLLRPEDRLNDSTLASMTALYMYEVRHNATVSQKSIDVCRYLCLRKIEIGCRTQMVLNGFWS